jgi:hypothetical protein
MRKHFGRLDPGSIRVLRRRTSHPIRRLAGAAIAAAALLTPCAQASGPRTLTPEFFATPYSRVELIDGTRFVSNDSFSRTLLYLHLSGRFTEQHRELFTSLRPQAPGPLGTNPAYEWRQMVMTATGEPYEIEPTKYVRRAVTRNGIAGTQTWYTENCQADAFVTAIATFNDRRTRDGESSAEFRRWLEAQLLVFANCSEPELRLPAPPEAGWTMLAQQDRRYQIAASYFYNLQYARAAELFAEIAADSDSPWADVSRYLVARCLIREAVTNGVDVDANLRAALALLREMAAEEPYLARFPSVTGLIRYVEIKLDTPAFLRETARLVLESPAALDASALEDFLLLVDSGAFDSAVDGVAEQELLRWLRLARSARVYSVATSSAIGVSWRDTGNPAWLYLAVDRDPGQTSIAEARERRADLSSLDQSTPAYAEMLVRIAHSLASAGDKDAARELAEQALDGGLVLKPEHDNSLEYLLASLIEDPIERLGRSDLLPVAMRYDGSGFAAYSGDALRQATRGGTLFPAATIEMVNRDFTPAMLLDAAERIPFNDYIEGRLIIAAWVRSILTGDDDSARRAAELLKSPFPGLATELDRFIENDNGEFTAAYIVLTHPGFSPWMPDGIGRQEWDASGLVFPAASVALPYRSQNWWCASALPTATEFFGPIVLEHASTAPEDPRVPEALHRLVFAGRHSCPGGAGAMSRAAFERLHTRYPDSEWAAKTPYWYE